MRWLVVLIAALVVMIPCVSAQTEQPWCGVTTLYFQHNLSTSPPGYEELINRPSGGTEVDENVTIKNTDGWVLIDTYITPVGALDETTADLAGLRRYRFYSYVSGTSGTTVLNFTPYLYRNGTLYQKFYSVETEDINSLTVTEYLQSYVSNSTLYLQPGDRIAIQVWAKTTHSSYISIHWVYQGSTHTSHVESGYFVCPSPDPVYVASDIAVRDTPIPVCIPILALATIVVVMRRYR